MPIPKFGPTTPPFQPNGASWYDPPFSPDYPIPTHLNPDPLPKCPAELLKPCPGQAPPPLMPPPVINDEYEHHTRADIKKEEKPKKEGHHQFSPRFH